MTRFAAQFLVAAFLTLTTLAGTAGADEGKGGKCTLAVKGDSPTAKACAKGGRGCRRRYRPPTGPWGQGVGVESVLRVAGVGPGGVGGAQARIVAPRPDHAQVGRVGRHPAPGLGCGTISR